MTRVENTQAPPRPQPLRPSLPIGTDPHSVRQRIEALEKALEHGFRIPGIGYEFGLDAIVGLIPVVGDFVGAAFGAYLVWEAKNLDMPKWKVWRMAGNVGLDTAVGLIPFVGDAVDFLFRSNSRNLKILKRHLDKHHPQTRVIEG
jgi:hypothetical protein